MFREIRSLMNLCQSARVVTIFGPQTCQPAFLEIRRNLTEEQRKTRVSAPDDDHDLLEKPDESDEVKFVVRSDYANFVYNALKKLKENGKHRDLATYKEILKVFPPGVYTPKNVFQRLGMFNAEQQLAACELLSTMERNKVYPDKELEKLVAERFSKYSDAWRKCVRMNYWSAKMRNVNPYPVPEETPQQGLEVAKLALARMCVDKQTIISIMNTSRVSNSIDKTWVVSAQSPLQRDLIDELDSKTILYIEEGGRVWANDKSIIYFVLKHEHVQPKVDDVKKTQDYNSMNMQFYGRPVEDKVSRVKSIHDVEDGVILAICATGTSSQDSLLSWSRLLQSRHEYLNDLSIVFRLRRPHTQLVSEEQSSGDTQGSMAA